jgi:hypothetical protein
MSKLANHIALFCSHGQLTIRQRGRVVYERIVNEAKPS